MIGDPNFGIESKFAFIFLPGLYQVLSASGDQAKFPFVECLKAKILF